MKASKQDASDAFRARNPDGTRSIRQGLRCARVGSRIAALSAVTDLHVRRAIPAGSRRVRIKQSSSARSSKDAPLVRCRLFVCRPVGGGRRRTHSLSIERERSRSLTHGHREPGNTSRNVTHSRFLKSAPRRKINRSCLPAGKKHTRNESAGAILRPCQLSHVQL